MLKGHILGWHILVSYHHILGWHILVLHTVFHQQWKEFLFFLQQFVIFLEFSSSNRYRPAVLSHCGFQLSTMLSIFWYVFLPSVDHLWWGVHSDLCAFLIGLFNLLFSFKNFVYILNTNSFSDLSFANIFFQYVACLFVPFTRYFPEYKL